MKEITYGIIKETYRCENSSRISYGIAAYSNEKADGSATVLEVINDISSDEQSVVELVKKFNSLKLSLCHLKDAVEDFIAIN